MSILNSQKKKGKEKKREETHTETAHVKSLYLYTQPSHDGNQPGNYRFFSARKVYVSSCFELCLIISTAMKTMFYFLLREQARNEALFLQRILIGLIEYFLCEPKEQNGVVGRWKVVYYDQQVTILREERITTAQLPRKRSITCGAKTISLITCHLKKRQITNKPIIKKIRQSKSSLDLLISLHIFVSAIILKHEKKSPLWKREKCQYVAASPTRHQ